MFRQRLRRKWELRAPQTFQITCSREGLLLTHLPLFESSWLCLFQDPAAKPGPAFPSSLSLCSHWLPVRPGVVILTLGFNELQKPTPPWCPGLATVLEQGLMHDPVHSRSLSSAFSAQGKLAPPPTISRHFNAVLGISDALSFSIWLPRERWGRMGRSIPGSPYTPR